MSTSKEEVRRNAAGLIIPNSSDSLVVIMRYLMSYCVCPGDHDYNKRAVDSLLKKLLDNREDINALISIITTRGSHPDKCLTVPRTLDGRFQVASRKGFPHVVYGRIWRWGDLHKCQIIHIPSCEYGFDLKRDDICVNPYHYERISSVEELHSIFNYDANKNDTAVKSRKNEVCTKNIPDVDDGKKQGEPQQPSLQSSTSDDLQQNRNAYKPNEEKLIPIVVEDPSNAAEYNEPQHPDLLPNYKEEEEPTIRPQDPETYVMCDISNSSSTKSPIQPCSPNNQNIYSNNLLHNLNKPAIENDSHQQRDVQLLQTHGHNKNNEPVQLQGRIQENQNNIIQDNRNVETPMVSLSMCEQFLLDQSDFQSFPSSNGQRHNNFQQINDFPISSSSNSLIMNNQTLLPNCSQQSQDLVLDNPDSVELHEMLPPRKSLSTDSRFANDKEQPQDVVSNFRLLQMNNVPPPSSTPLPHNPPTFEHSIFDNFQPTERLNNEPLINYNQELPNKDTSLNFTIGRILAENNSQQIVINNPIENTFNETLDHILSQVQNNVKKLPSVDHKLQNKNAILAGNTEPIATRSNIKEVLNSDEELTSDNIPTVVANYNKEITEQNNNQQLKSINNVPDFTKNAEEILLPRCTITPLTTVNAIRSLSSIGNIEPAPSEQFRRDQSSLLQLDDDRTFAGEINKQPGNKEKLHSDKTVFLHKDLEETVTENNNARGNSPFSKDNTELFISNNNQSKVSTVPQCEQYLQNHIQPPVNNNTNNNNNNEPHIYNEVDHFNQTFNSNCKPNNTHQIHNSMQPHDKELQRNNINDFFNIPNLDCTHASNLIPIISPPLEHWCSIAYFEMDTQVGETFKVKNSHTTIVVDGYLDPDGGDRFCLGRLSNVCRTAQSERTRMHIAQGIALELREDDDIWLRCKSRNSVFIQAHFLDMQSQRPTRNFVHKIFPGNCEKVFDLQKCYKHMKAQIATAQAAFKAQITALGSRTTKNYSVSEGLGAMGMNVDDLRRLCILQISFVKGWGPDYPRQTIKETPCWIEVHVHKALQILDDFLLLKKPIIRGMD